MSIESSLSRLADAVEGLATKVIRMERAYEEGTSERETLSVRVSNLAVVLVESIHEIRSLRRALEEETAARRSIGITVMEHEADLRLVRPGGSNGSSPR